MKMQMGKLIRISSIVYLCRMKNFIHRTSGTDHIRHKRITLFITQLKQIVHMLFVGYQTTSPVGLFFKKNTLKTDSRAISIIKLCNVSLF